MTTVQSTNTPINAPTKSASPSAASGTTSNNARSSYATATKGAQLSPSVNASSGSQAVVGGLALSQHAHSNSLSPVNGRPSAPPTAPTGPAIVSSTNGNPSQSDHTRKSSVTISAQGPNYVPNGAAPGPARPNISFGSMNTPSPNMAHSTPHMHSNSLSTSYGGPNPARSPSPIPPPPVSSGGRPPSSLGAQSAVNFGSLPGADGSDQSLPLRPGIPSGPVGSQAQHLRRESSQSAHSDTMNRNYGSQNGRMAGGGRPPFNNQQYSAQGSPSMFRPAPHNMQRTPSNVPAFGNQMNGPIRGPNSPFQANRSPALPPHAQPHMQGSPMPHQYGYPPHMQPAPGMFVPPEYPQYGYPGYPPNGAFMPQVMPGGYQPPHPSISPQPPTQFRPQAPYTPGPYAQQSATPMSRDNSSSGIARPTSSIGHSPTPGPLGQSTGPSVSPAPSASTFTRPVKKSSAIRITNADGKVVDFKKTIQSPSTTTASRGPAVVSSGGSGPAAATPPRALTPSSSHARTESVQAKTAEERRKEFEETVKRQLEAEAAEKKKGEEEEAAKKEKAKEAEAAAAKAEEEAAAAKAEEAKAEAEAAATPKETEEERKKREEEEEQERWIAELEAEEREEEEREKAYQEKKRKAKEEAARKEAEAAANEEAEMRRLEKEAEEREEIKLKAKADGQDEDDNDAELFSKLKKNTMFGPGAGATPVSGASTPGSDSPMPPPVVPASAAKPAPLAGKQKPAALKLETTKSVEPAQATAGMQSLQSARFLQIKSESINYPEGIRSPNPSLNQSSKSRGQRYDNNFLLQFRDVFREKPTTEWDKIIKDTVGDGTDSARPSSARTPSIGGRSLSNRPGMPATGSMGSFVGGASGPRTLPPNTTSAQRFEASMQPARGPPAGAFGSFQGGRPGAAFPMGAPGMIRTPSSQSMQSMNSPRNASQRGKGSRRGGQHPAQEAEMQKKMPLTAGMSITPLEVSKEGWKPASIVAPQTVVAVGHMAPDMVQRKVKAALNKMTPEKFDKISNDILVIASQSKDETDGRTLRQVIQLTFEKACDEAHWASMYAKFCKRMLEEMGPDIRDESVKDKTGAVVVGGALFRKYLLNRCQEEFERGWEVNLPDKPEGQTEEAAMLSDEYYIAAAAKRRGLGLIQFIGELYKLGMLTLRIMHECVVKLLNFEGVPDEAAVESLVKLLRTIGQTMDSDPKGRSMIDTYMERVEKIMKMEGLPSRTHYMLLDTLELRRKQWRSKEDAKGPKTIQEIREDALMAQQAADIERQKSSRGGPGGRPPQGRGDMRSFSGGGMPAPDYRSNNVGMDDLKKLTRNARNTSSGPGSLGPNSLLSSSRSGSRRGLGPMSRGGEDSGASSRTGTPPVKEKESAAHANTFSALAALEGDHPDDIASPPSQHVSPALTKAQPATAGEADEGKSS